MKKLILSLSIVAAGFTGFAPTASAQRYQEPVIEARVEGPRISIGRGYDRDERGYVGRGYDRDERGYEYDERGSERGWGRGRGEGRCAPGSGPGPRGHGRAAPDGLAVAGPTLPGRARPGAPRVR